VDFKQGARRHAGLTGAGSFSCSQKGEGRAKGRPGEIDLARGETEDC